jgi:hypothetical protein
MNTVKLKFFFGNKKLPKYVCHFSIPSGWTCPFAKACLAKVSRETGRLIEGENEFRCYSASEECCFPTCRNARWYNLDLLKGKSKREMISLIEFSLPEMVLMRLHVGGDFFNQTYFDAWLEVAKNHSEATFYGYTKSLPFWVKRLKQIPDNFRLTASYGGKHDDLIKKYNLNYSKVVSSELEAGQLGLPIDTDDKIAQAGKESFALLIHGMGRKGSLQTKLHTEKRMRLIK